MVLDRLVRQNTKLTSDREPGEDPGHFTVFHAEKATVSICSGTSIFGVRCLLLLSKYKSKSLIDVPVLG